MEPVELVERLNALGGAFGIGVVAGLLGDKWNLGFLAEGRVVILTE